MLTLITLFLIIGLYLCIWINHKKSFLRFHINLFGIFVITAIYLSFAPFILIYSWHKSCVKFLKGGCIIE